MKYTSIGQNPDGSVTIRIFMDDGHTYDQDFTVVVPTYEQVLDDLVAPVMRSYVEVPPTQETLDDPEVPVWCAATPEAPADIPEDATSVDLVAAAEG